MELINIKRVQQTIDQFAGDDVFIHVEITNGAYASHKDKSFFSSGAFVRNAQVCFEHGKITGEGPFRVGLKLPFGWVYAEGLTHFQIDEQGRLLLAGHDYEGKLAVALQISKKPFD